MRHAVVPVLVTLLLAPAAAGGQARRRTVTKPSPAIRAAAERISQQAKVLGAFLYAFGKIVKSIEASEQAAKGHELPAATLAQIERNKSAVVESIRGLQPALQLLESDMRADPALQAYARHVAGLADDAGLAADAASAGRFDDAAKLLVDIIGVLMDALLPPKP